MGLFEQKERSMNELALFAGAGGGILGGHLLGWRTVCAVEIEDYPRRVLLSRQRDGILPRFPIWDDVRTFDGNPWRGRVDIVTGGFPCQDISAAGKGAGITGERSGLWAEMARIIGEVQPRYALVENSPMLVGRGLGVVLGDLAALGYDARWGVLSAADTGAPHLRERIWIVAANAMFVTLRNEAARNMEPQKPKRAMLRCNGAARKMGHPKSFGRHETQAPGSIKRSQLPGAARRPGSAIRGRWWASEPDMGRVANGVANRVDRISAIGNGQVPAVVALAWQILGPGNGDE
jgi:DNA (cytosine-5)-methyltransferase 1